MPPIDLTTIGAAVELPPPDHPIFAEIVELPNLEMSRAEMAWRIVALEAEIRELRRFVGLYKDSDYGQ